MPTTGISLLDNGSTTNYRKLIAPLLLQSAVKLINIIVPDRQLHYVNRILREADVGGMSYYRIEGRSKAKATEFIPKYKIEVVVRDDQVEALINRIGDGIGGDITTGGKIFVIDVTAALDLSTRKKGEAAI
jgi:nitrogen regulatory protein P-II 1